MQKNTITKLHGSPITILKQHYQWSANKFTTDSVLLDFKEMD